MSTYDERTEHDRGWIAALDDGCFEVYGSERYVSRDALLNAIRQRSTNLVIGLPDDEFRSLADVSPRPRSLVIGHLLEVKKTGTLNTRHQYRHFRVSRIEEVSL